MPIADRRRSRPVEGVEAQVPRPPAEPPPEPWRGPPPKVPPDESPPPPLEDPEPEEPPPLRQ